jgi:hypothetical protein
MSKRDFAIDLFNSYKTGYTKKKKIIEERTQTPGDPTLIASVTVRFLSELPAAWASEILSTSRAPCPARLA